MSEHVTVVYYDTDGHPSAFHVNNPTQEKLQAEFYVQDVAAIKNITIESNRLADRKFKTLFLEQDILDFLDEWSIEY